MSDETARERVPTRRRCGPDLEPLAYHPGDRGRDGSRYRPAVRTAGDGQLVCGVTAPVRYDAAGALLSAAWHDAWEERHCRAMAGSTELFAACQRMVAALTQIADGGLLLPPYAAALDAGRHAIGKVLALERDDDPAAG